MKIINCFFCNKEFKAKFSQVKNGRKFCSTKCYGLAKIKFIVQVCEVCPTQFNIVPSKITYGRGKFCSKECFFLSESGRNHWNWKGGITPENHKIRNSIEMLNWRISVFKRDNYTCQECLTRGGILNADHIKPFAYYPKLRLDLNNGRTLCFGCHKKTKTYGSFNKKFLFNNSYVGI